MPLFCHNSIVSKEYFDSAQKCLSKVKGKVGQLISLGQPTRPSDSRNTVTILASLTIELT